MYVSILRRSVMTVSLIAVLVMSSASAWAAPYGNGAYGRCAYQTSCPVVPPPATPPPTGESVPTTTPSSGTVSADVDNDGNPEQATDTDNNPGNGYEEFSDPDGSSKVITRTDGEHNGAPSYLIDTDNDGVPNVYWSPGDKYVSEVEKQVLGDNTVWSYQNSKGETQYYYPYPKSQSGGTTKYVPTVTPDQPVEHRITGDNFGGPVYEKIGEIAKKIPAPVAYSFPYLLLILIALLIVRLIWQTRRELARLRIALATIEREKGLVLEKQNFLMLASHYLRTPLTVLKGNIELMQSLKQISDTTAGQLQTAAGSIQEEANTLLANLEANQGLSQISVSQTAAMTWRKALLSPFVIGPFIGVILLLLFVNFIFADFRVTKPNVIDMLVQVVALVILAQWLVSTIRKRHINRQNRLEQQRVLDAQRELDAARSNFISGATAGLAGKIATFEQQLAQVAATGADVSRVQKAIDQLRGIADKFGFAAQLQAANVQASRAPFNSAFVVQSVVASNQQKAADKKVLLDTQAQGGQINQNQQLLTTVLDSVVDNAIKYSTEKGAVRVEQRADKDGVRYSVADQGAGMTNDQLATLFKPFSRAESAETFNTEGLGFSLYLDRLIMHYLGGDMHLTSEPGKGTQAEMIVPHA